jgi:hypothetical protein
MTQKNFVVKNDLTIVGGDIYSGTTGQITLPSTGVITIPNVTGTLATLGGTETLTNKTITSPTLSNPSFSGATSNMGTVTEIDINGGTIDSTSIGATTASTGAFTTVSASGATSITDTTDSTSTSAGALIVSGGVGIAKNLNAGGNVIIGSGGTSSASGVLTLNGPELTGSGPFLDIKSNSTSVVKIGTESGITASGTSTNILIRSEKPLTISTLTTASTATTNISILTGDTTTSGNTGEISIKTGNSTGATSGDITIDSGTGTTKGKLNLGTTNASEVNVGSIGVNIKIKGNLIVDGTTTTLNSNTISIDDKNIELGSVASISNQSANITAGSNTVTVASTAGYAVGQLLTKVTGTGAFGTNATIASITNATTFTTSVNHTTAGSITFNIGAASNDTANGGGITLKGSSDKTISWDKTKASWDSSEHINLANTKAYYINGTSVLNSTTLGATVTASSLTSVGIISTGTWNGNTLAGTYGGTGVNNGTKTITLGGDFATSGDFTTTLTVTANTNVTLPTTGTLATLGGAETLTNKKIVEIGGDAASAAKLWEGVTTGSIAIGGGLTSGSIAIGKSTQTGATTLYGTIKLPQVGTSGFVKLTTGGQLSSDSTTYLSGTVAVGNGGTGLTTYSTGDLLYASAATTISKLAGVALGNVLISGGTGTAPSWGKVSLTNHVTGTLAVSNGGTGLATIGTSGQILSSNGTAASWINIPTLNQNTTGTAANVTGTVAIANGGTGATSASAARTNLGAAALAGDITQKFSTNSLLTKSVVLQLTPKEISTALLNGAATSNYFGESVALSADGNVLVVGASGVNSNTGRVYTYYWLNSSWIEISTALLNGAATSNYFGESVALSADGKVLVVGAIGVNSNTGRVYTYDLSGSGINASWTQRTGVLDGANTSNYFGVSVALSADGKVLVVGAYWVNSYRGRVYTYDLSGSGINASWTQRTGLLDGVDINGLFGISVALSADGKILVVGAYSANSNTGRVYTYDLSGSGINASWTQRTGVLDGAAISNYFGVSVALSADGNVLVVCAIGFNSNTGRVYTYDLSGSGISATWTQRTGLLDGAGTNDFGRSVSLSADGNVLVVSAPVFNTNTGRVYTYAIGNNAPSNKLNVAKLNGDSSQDFTVASLLLSRANISCSANALEIRQNISKSNVVTIDGYNHIISFDNTTGNIDFKGNTTSKLSGATDTSQTSFFKYTRSTPTFSITGALTATGDITAFYSDDRLKTRISNISSPIDKVLSLNGFYYTNNETANTLGYLDSDIQVGLSAQEVEKILPEIVTLAPIDMDIVDGKRVSKSGENYKTINYAKIVPLLVEAIKEQQNMILELKARLNNLEK